MHAEHNLVDIDTLALDATPGRQVPIVDMGASFQRCLNELLCGLAAGTPVAVLTGEPGTGKSALLAHLAQEIQPPAKVVQIPYANLEYSEFLGYIGLSLDAVLEIASDNPKNDEILDYLRGERHRQRSVIVLVDDAQALCRSVLRRMVDVFELDRDIPLAQFVLAGTDQLDHQLREEGSRRLPACIDIRCTLERLDAAESAHFVAAVTASAPQMRVDITAEARQFLVARSHGVLRLLRKACEGAMVATKERGYQTITLECASSVWARTFGTQLGRIDGITALATSDTTPPLPYLETIAAETPVNDVPPAHHTQHRGTDRTVASRLIAAANRRLSRGRGMVAATIARAHSATPFPQRVRALRQPVARLNATLAPARARLGDIATGVRGHVQAARPWQWLAAIYPPRWPAIAAASTDVVRRARQLRVGLATQVTRYSPNLNRTRIGELTARTRRAGELMWTVLTQPIWPHVAKLALRLAPSASAAKKTTATTLAWLLHKADLALLRTRTWLATRKLRLANQDRIDASEEAVEFARKFPALAATNGPGHTPRLLIGLGFGLFAGPVLLGIALLMFTQSDLTDALPRQSTIAKNTVSAAQPRAASLAKSPTAPTPPVVEPRGDTGDSAILAYLSKRDATQPPQKTPVGGWATTRLSDLPPVASINYPVAEFAEDKADVPTPVVAKATTPTQRAPSVVQGDDNKVSQSPGVTAQANPSRIRPVSLDSQAKTLAVLAVGQGRQTQRVSALPNRESIHQANAKLVTALATSRSPNLSDALAGPSFARSGESVADETTSATSTSAPPIAKTYPAAAPVPDDVTRKSYRVRSGDSLLRIAGRYDMTLTQLLAENEHLSTKKALRVGQVITIPPNNAIAQKWYSVRSGDTLWEISKRLDVPMRDLKSLNGLSASRIVVGQRLRLPPET